MNIDDVDFEMETAAGCYLGETFARTYNGHWQWSAPFDTRAGVNFYRAGIQFGKYTFKPFRWLGIQVGERA